MQSFLFTLEEEQEFYAYYPNFLTEKENDYYFSILQKETPWQQPLLKIHGKKVLQPRLSAWYGDPNTDYFYSGISHVILPWSSTLKELKEKVEKKSGFSFNSVLLNYYRNGNDAVSWHADDEKNLHPAIASLSLGYGRYFYIKPKKLEKSGTIKSIKIWLEGGSLLLMYPGFQDNYLHAVLRMKSYPFPRINLTFRKVLFS